MVVKPVPGSPEAFAAYLKRDSEKWGAVIKAAHLSIE
jgi:tripartite-type tricarboxylate transporter receptor subunit TctC